MAVFTTFDQYGQASILINHLWWNMESRPRHQLPKEDLAIWRDLRRGDSFVKVGYYFSQTKSYLSNMIKTSSVYNRLWYNIIHHATLAIMSTRKKVIIWYGHTHHLKILCSQLKLLKICFSIHTLMFMGNGNNVLVIIIKFLISNSRSYAEWRCFLFLFFCFIWFVGGFFYLFCFVSYIPWYSFSFERITLIIDMPENIHIPHSTSSNMQHL